VSGLRVGVDATSWFNRRGFGRFTRNAIGRLVELDAATTYVLWVDHATAATDGLPDGIECAHVSIGAPVHGGGARSPRDVLRLARSARGRRLDAFLFPSVYTYFPVIGVPKVVGLHDTIADDLPKLTLPGRRDRAMWRAKESFALRTASVPFTVSETSRSALSRRFGLDPGRIAVVPEAPAAIFGPREKAAMAPALAQLGVEPGGFLLYAGGISPHKDIETLVEAYARLQRETSGVPPLVIAGDLHADPYLSAAAGILERIRALGLEEAVRLPGFVTDEVLACLYGGATAVVLTSLAEGFGLPAVEAAACAAPVVLSDIGAHREALGEAGVYFPAGDAAALVAELKRLLADSGLRERLGDVARRRVEGLSWEDTALRLKELVERAASR